MQDSILLCSTCQVTTADQESYKAHFKSEFHRYNIKRKLIDLPPLDETLYHQRQVVKEESGQLILKQYYCEPCNKKFQTQSTFENHLSSNKHRQTKQQPTKERRDSTQPEAQQERTSSNASVCLFCNHVSNQPDSNMKHMQVKHGFFILEAEQLVDLEGLLLCLGKKIHDRLQCLMCYNPESPH